MEGKEYHLLIINIGSVSTKVYLYRNEENLIAETVYHSFSQLSHFHTINDQLPFRREVVEEIIKKDRKKIDIVVSRGGLTKPLFAGAYHIDEKMCEDLYHHPSGEHPTNLGPIIAFDIARSLKVPAITVDTPSSDEFDDLARISGLPEIRRVSAFHTLNQKAAARKVIKNLRFLACGNQRFPLTSSDLRKKYNESNLVVAHLGGGISIGAHKEGRIVDATHGLSEGPFTPDRAGSLPTSGLLELCFSGRFSREDLQKKLVGTGGLAAYLGTNDARVVEKKISDGDDYASLIYEAMAYQIAKEIGAMSTVLMGKVDAIVLTGRLANSKRLVGWIRERVDQIAPVMVYPGEDEMEILNLSGLGVLRGEEEAKEY